jgi:hypothetical protein
MCLTFIYYQVKVDQYWPDTPQIAMRFGDVTVEMIGQRNVDGYNVLDLKVTMVIIQ